MHCYLTSSSQKGKLPTYMDILREGNPRESVPQEAIPELPSISKDDQSKWRTINTSSRASPANPSNTHAVESFRNVY